MLVLTKTALGARAACGPRSRVQHRTAPSVRVQASSGGSSSLSSRVKDYAILSFWPAEAPARPDDETKKHGAPSASGSSAPATLLPAKQLQHAPPGALTTILPTELVTKHSVSWEWSVRDAEAGKGLRDEVTGLPMAVYQGLTPAQMEAVPLILSFVYSGKLQLADGSTPSVALLATAYQLAMGSFRFFEYGPFGEAMRAAMATLTPEQLAAAGTSDLLQLFDVANPEVKQRVQEQICIRAQPLVEEFEDVNQLLNSGLRYEFIQLNLSDVLAWARSDQLQLTHSENEVAAALDLWVYAQPLGFLTEEQQEQLAACVRVQQLTPAYRFHFLAMDWAQPHTKLQQLVGLLSSKQPTFQAGGSRSGKLEDVLGLPPGCQWLAGPRTKMLAAEAEARRAIELTYAKHDLDETIQIAMPAGGCEFYPNDPLDELYISGHTFKFDTVMDTCRSTGEVFIETQLTLKLLSKGYDDYPDTGRPPVLLRAVVEHCVGGRWESISALEQHFMAGACDSFADLVLLRGKFSSHKGLQAEGLGEDEPLRVRIRFLEAE